MKDIIVILGPTASGKSGAALEIAKHIDCELISADSMQIYRKMDIGTAKPSKEEQALAVHHMIDIVDVDENFSVAEFKKRSFKIIDDLHIKDKIPVVVGGTGLYINSIVYNLDFTETPSDENFRNEMDEIKKEKGLDFLYDLLKEKDEEAAKRIHPNDEKRIIRRLEILNNEKGNPKKFDFEEKRSGYNFKIFGLNHEREVLYERINKRADIMVEKGLFDEVKNLYGEYGDDNIALMAIGYKEIIDHLKGNIGKDEAIELIKRNSRRFAKRQITWFKRDTRTIWLDFSENNCLNSLIYGIK